MSANLVIKSPTQQVNDQKIECQMTWSVDQLKEYISQVYPTKPKKENQKLIYCGQLLPDNLKLLDILHHNGNEVHTLHLVCHQANQNFLSQSGNQNVSSHPSSSSVTNTTSPSISASSSDISEDGVRQRRNIERIVNHPVPPIPANLPTSSVDVASQMALMQQAYAQYMSQYLMYIQSRGTTYFASPLLNTNSSSNSAPTAPTNESSQNSGVQNGPGNQNAGVEPQAPPPPVAAVPLQNDVEANGDMLDYIYILSRFLILASILYIYSSFGRILLVSGLALLLYLYHNGRLSRRRSRNGPQTAAASNNGPEDPNRTPSNDQPGAQGESDRQDQNVGETEGQNTGESHAEEARSETSPVTAVWTFLTAFFSSLIPEQPIPVNIN